MNKNAEHLIGMPKSGMNWKKRSKKSTSRHIKHSTLSWDEKQRVKKDK